MELSSEIKFAVLATDVAIFSVDENNLKVLLIDAKDGPFAGTPTLPGGLIKPTEKIRDAVSRFIGEVLNKKEDYREQLFTFGNPGRDPGGRVVSVTYLALIPWEKAKKALKNGSYWQDVKTLPKLGYDHNDVLVLAIDRLSAKIGYTNIIYGLMPEEFTLTDLQTVYEIVLDRQLDKRNFRKKVHSLKILKKLPRKKRAKAARPAQLFSFRKRSLEVLDIL